MARIVRNNIYQVFWHLFRQLFRIRGDFDCGTVNLSHGQWILYFDTAESPSNVWFNIQENFTLPVCGGTMSTIGSSMDKHGFYLFADIRSNDCIIHWFTSEY